MLYICYVILNKGYKMKLENDIRRCRFEQGDISQETLANAVGVSRQTIHSIEKRKYIPSTLLALKIARFFKKPVEDIFFIVED